jgi:hypothetical protein
MDSCDDYTNFLTTEYILNKQPVQKFIFYYSSRNNNELQHSITDWNHFYCVTWI